MTTKAAIFDLDGTLSDSAALHAESWRRLAVELAVPMTDDLFRRTFGRANADIIPMLLGRAVPPDELARHSDRKEGLFRGLAAERLQLYPGALDLLQDLAAGGWRLGIGSSTPRANLAFALPHLGLSELMSAVVGMEDVTRHKPEPDVFLEVARRLAVPPERCLVFEDAPAGIAAAVRAGMRGIALTTHHPAESFAGATAIRDGLWAVTAEDCRAWLGKGD